MFNILSFFRRNKKLDTIRSVVPMVTSEPNPTIIHKKPRTYGEKVLHESGDVSVRVYYWVGDLESGRYHCEQCVERDMRQANYAYNQLMKAHGGEV